MKNTRKDDAVSEIIGVAILLGIAIFLFSIVQITALSFPFNPNPPSARLVGNIEGDTIYIFHHGGESLSLDKIRVIFTIEGFEPVVKNASDILNPITSNGDGLWNIGEKLNYTHSGLAGLSVYIMVIDVESNSVIMQSTIQE